MTMPALRRLLFCLLLAGSLAGAWSGTCLAQPAPSKQPPASAVVLADDQGFDDVLGHSAKVLIKLLVLAALLESALEIVFKWRPFIAYFDGRGVKTPITLLCAWAMVVHFDIDFLAPLLSDYQTPTASVASEGVVHLLTAMIIAGGSSGVNNLLGALGYRRVVSAEDLKARPPKTEAWISVARVKPATAVGPVQVQISEGGSAFLVAGTIQSVSTRLKGLRFFIRDPGRLPTAGGISVAPNVAYKVRLAGQNAKGVALLSASTWETDGLRLGALVDIELSI